MGFNAQGSLKYAALLVGTVAAAAGLNLKFMALGNEAPANDVVATDPLELSDIEHLEDVQLSPDLIRQIIALGAESVSDNTVQAVATASSKPPAPTQSRPAPASTARSMMVPQTQYLSTTSLASRRRSSWRYTTATAWSSDQPRG